MIRVTNEEVRKELTNMELLSVTVTERKIKWLGHVLRLEKSDHISVKTQWRPDVKRKPERQKETWKRTVEREGA